MSLAERIKHYYVAVGSQEVKMATLLDLVLALQSPLVALQVVVGSRDTLDEVVTGLAALGNSVKLCVLHADLSEEQRAAVVSKHERNVERLFGGGARQEEQAGSRPEVPPEQLQETSKVVDLVLQHGLRREGPAEQPAEGEPRLVDHVGLALGLAARPPEPERPPASPHAPPPAALVKAAVLVGTDATLRPADSLPGGRALLLCWDLPRNKEVFARRMALLARRPPPRLAVHFVVAGEMAALRALEAHAAPAALEQLSVHVAEIFDA